MWKKEKDDEQLDIVKILDQKVVIVMDPDEVQGKEKILGKDRTKEKQYAFDLAFDKYTS